MIDDHVYVGGLIELDRFGIMSRFYEFLNKI